MTLITLIAQILLTIPLTIILKYINKKENNLINRLIIPTVYIIIVSALIPEVSNNIYLIVVFEIFIRNFYVTNISGEETTTSKTSFLIESLLSVILSIFTYSYFISKVDTVIPNPEDIKGFIWFLIIIYLVSLYKISTKDKQAMSEIKKKTLKSEKVIMQYAKFKNLYYDIIKSKNNVINNLTYAIMINEEYKNPSTYRKVKENFNAILRKEYSYGIMQEKSVYHISDRESIINAINRFEKLLKNNNLKEKEQVDKILNNYADEDKTNIMNIYTIITDFNKK